MLQDMADNKSTLVQVMARCHQAKSHYLSPCWGTTFLSYISYATCLNWPHKRNYFSMLHLLSKRMWTYLPAATFFMLHLVSNDQLVWTKLTSETMFLCSISYSIWANWHYLRNYFSMQHLKSNLSELTLPAELFFYASFHIQSEWTDFTCGTIFLCIISYPIWVNWLYLRNYFSMHHLISNLSELILPAELFFYASSHIRPEWTDLTCRIISHAAPCIKLMWNNLTQGTIFLSCNSYKAQHRNYFPMLHLASNLCEINSLAELFLFHASSHT